MKTSTVLEITESHAKLLQTKTVRGKKIISSCDVRALPNFTDEEINKAFIDLVLSKSVRPDDFVFVLPRKICILKTIKLPAVQEVEIRKMLQLQISSLTPYAAEEIVYDIHLLDKDPAGYTQVLVIVVNREQLSRYLRIFEKLGIHLSRISLSSFGVLGWYQHYELKKKIDLKQSVMVLDVDINHTEACFFQDKKIYFSRYIEYGAKHLDADNLIAYANQIRLTHGAYEKERIGPEVKKVLLLSMSSSVLMLKDKLEQELKLPVEMINPFDNVLSQKNINLSALRDNPGLSLAVPIGFLMADAKRWINLTPQEVFETKQSKVQQKQWLMFVGLVMILLVLMLSVFGFEVYRRITYLKELDQKLQQTSPRIKTAEEKVKVIQFINKELKQRIYLPDLMYELVSLTPPEISFQSIHLNDRGQFTIQGYAETGGSVNMFQANLVKSPVFKEVNLEFATKRRIFNLEITDFKITSQVQGQDKK